MLRLPRLSARLPSISSRGLVSSALLSRAWQNASIAELRSEAKLRGLSAKGSKAALVSRIEDHETSFHKSNIALSRLASSVSSAPAQSINTTEAPGNPEPPVVPHVPFILDSKIPDLSVREPLPPVQVPYVPDFWNSSTPDEPAVEEALPKVLVVAGAETHHGGGPSHSSLDLEEPQNKLGIDYHPKSTRSSSFLDDLTEDLGLPPVSDIKKGISSLFK
ncbi:hypothetical protein BDN70DRAFT_873366 [Pholiota conissans]|uniref:SAP domain-containing protein n=1 Tax=Pholiota conissans TaxID=109636 RepID=A0A9P5ZAT8_9AGAR|nr:hypothetical protein BDN70DRAFT_873366 [Pholiota conissans]